MTVTYLNGGINAAVTAATVRGAAEFPVSGSFDVVIDNERMTIGAGAGTTVWSSITRGVQGTTAAVHADGAAVYLVAQAYGSIDELAALLPGLPAAANRNTLLLSQIAGDATALITSKCGRDFFRHPTVTGTEQRLFDIRIPTRRLIVPEGIVSISSLEYASNTGGSFTALGSTDWFLRPSQPEPEDSYYVVELSDQGTVPVFYQGIAIVRGTGVFGYAAVPSVIRAGWRALAREMYVLVPTGRGGASVAAAGLGSSAIPELLPRATYEAIAWGSRRTRAWM